MTTFTCDEAAPTRRPAVALEVAEGWTRHGADASTAATLPAGGTLDHALDVVAPATADGSYDFVATAGYTTTAEPIGDRSVTSTTVARTLPGPPQADVFASDHPWVSATTAGARWSATVRTANRARATGRRSR